MTPKRNNREKSTKRRAVLTGATLLLGTLFLAGFFPGCDAREETPKKPQVVTKKIDSEKPGTPAESEPAAKAPEPEAQAAPGTGSPPKSADILALLGLTPKASDASGGTAYNPAGKIDPFEPLFRQEPETQAQKKRRVRKGPLTPLEKVDLSQLQLTGVILAKSGNKALVREASGKGYVVKVGTPIGTNFGRIVQILNDRIIVEEEVEDVMGKITLQKKEMRLQKPPGE